MSAMDNALLHASRHSPAYKAKEGITFALSYASLYLPESYYERDDKFSAENTFDISCSGGGSSSSLSVITVSISLTSDVFCC